MIDESWLDKPAEMRGEGIPPYEMDQQMGGGMIVKMSDCNNDANL